MESSHDPATAAPRWRYVLRALFYFLVLALVNILAFDGVRAILPTSVPRWLLLLVEAFAYLAGVLALTWAFCRFLDHSPVRELGLQRRRWLPKLAAGWGLGTLLQALIFLGFLAAGWLAVGPGRPEPLEFLASLVVWGVISFNEELSFRGYILQRLAVPWGVPAAVAVSSILFGLVHTINPNVQPLAVVSIVVAGVLLATAYLVTRSLWLPIGLHLGWNLAEIHLFGFAGSGTTEPALLHTAVSGPELMTGGAFGPEGGLVGLGATLLGIAVLLVGQRIALSRRREN